jgi:NTE family protein
MSPKAPEAEKTIKKINLALQGGGSHGAFTWGVLDALLEDNRLDFEGISATSAGSMNAVVMCSGYLQGGSKGARENLEKFWKKVSEAGAAFCPIQKITDNHVNPFMNFVPTWMNPETAMRQFTSIFSSNLSPYQFNPLNLNPLGDILEELVDFQALRKATEFKLFVTATNVRTGGARIFTTEELTKEMVLASAALPNFFQAVEIEGEAYWDGGYVGNPSLWPLFYETDGHDVLIVHVNPIIRESLPRDALSIEDRVNEITFNSAMLKEMRAISFVQKLLQKDMLKDEYKDRYRDVLMHAIRSEEVMKNEDFSSMTKLDTSWNLLEKLSQAGRNLTKKWLQQNFDKIGVKSSISLDDDYLEIAVDKKHKKAQKSE